MTPRQPIISNASATSGGASTTPMTPEEAVIRAQRFDPSMSRDGRRSFSRRPGTAARNPQGTPSRGPGRGHSSNRRPGRGPGKNARDIHLDEAQARAPRVTVTSAPEKSSRGFGKPSLGGHERSQIARKTTPSRPIEKDALKIYALGGLEEIGVNMMVIEYLDDIVIVDMGFLFPDETMPGIDYVIPNIASLVGKEKNIKGVIITHGHYDHIGAIPYLMPKLGWPPVYTMPLAKGLIMKRQEEFKNERLLKVVSVDTKSRYRLGRMEVEFFRVNHNIMDSTGVAIHTPEGIIVHTGDFKFDHTPVGEIPAEFAKIASYSDKKVLALCSDSTGAEIEGPTISERKIMDTLDGIIEKAPGRVIVGTFSSLITRLQAVIWIAEKYNKKIVVAGRSMLNNIEIAHQMGYIKMSKGLIIEDRDMRKIPKNRTIIMCTGAQGEENAVLMRIAMGEHRSISIEPQDTVVFSSSVIPGNERSVQNLVDAFYRQGAQVINYRHMDVHSSGHAHAEDLKLMLRLINPSYLIPVHGQRSFLHAHGRLGEAVGLQKDHVLIADNGQVMAFKNGSGRLTDTRVPTSYVMVDGLGVGDVSNVVLRDRREIAEGGLVIAILTIDHRTGQLVAAPEIHQRGFTMMQEQGPLMGQVIDHVKKVHAEHGKGSAKQEGATGEGPVPGEQPAYAHVKRELRNSLGSFIFSKTGRRPMILPVVIPV